MRGQTCAAPDGVQARAVAAHAEVLGRGHGAVGVGVAVVVLEVARDAVILCLADTVEAVVAVDAGAVAAIIKNNNAAALDVPTAQAKQAAAASAVTEAKAAVETAEKALADARAAVTAAETAKTAADSDLAQAQAQARTGDDITIPSIMVSQDYGDSLSGQIDIGEYTVVH